MEGYTSLPLLDQYVADLSDEDTQQIITSIEEERLTSYLRCTGNHREALQMYTLNARFSKHLHELIGGFEIALRNTVSSSIATYYGRSDWYRSRKFLMSLSSERRQNIKEVRKRLLAQHRAVRTGRIVAGLSFHFWVAMHENKYRDIVWTPHLHMIWPKGENLKRVHKDLLKIQDLRNRIAHFEPIFEARWRGRVDSVWGRFDQIAPLKSAWYRQRLAMKIDRLQQQ